MKTEATYLTHNGQTITISPNLDPRVVSVSAGRVRCRDEQAVRELRNELRAWGLVSMPLLGIG